MLENINASVGKEATNNPADVLLVQHLLNAIPYEQGGAASQLAEDGVVGNRTIAAIERFQKTALGFRWPDGRVDVGGKTFMKLLELAQRIMAEDRETKVFVSGQTETQIIDIPPVYIPDYTICDFIDPRITVEAQEALYAHLKKGEQERWEALHLWAAVKNNLIQGIYIQDQKKPALLSQRHGSAWWTMIPDGQDAILFPPGDAESDVSAAGFIPPEGAEPAETPLLAFRKKLVGNKDAIARALVDAWVGSAPWKIPVGVPYPSGKPCGQRPPSGEVIVGPITPVPPPTPQAPEIVDRPCPRSSADIHDRFEIHWNICSLQAGVLYSLCNLAELPSVITIRKIPIVIPTPTPEVCGKLPKDINTYIEARVCVAVHAELANHLGCLVSYGQVLGWYREWNAARPQ